MEQFLAGGILTDTVFIASLIAICIVYAVWRGTDLLLSLILALPTAAFIYSIFPYHHVFNTFFSSAPAWVAPVSIYGLLVLGILWIFRRVFGSAHGGEGAVHVIAASVSLTALLIALSYVLTPSVTSYVFSAPIATLFAEPISLFWILIGIFVVILFT